MEVLNVIGPGVVEAFGFGFGLCLMVCFVASGVVGAVTYIFSLMGGK